ncbi:hypothetical protein TUZN_1369 [Thermoproteus uzoniensis 768-20]|uniref:Uncharacterized protein n=1 Tax=Thermoproteus uzoniensis (strain 768-20) TaxID=999630 RepID=F2L1A9_THEU7|nr:hypothetical protein [Thermoproteus uzoniensis]AEA12845.1 hypothetical protein TUZN_1369 [Thermoproteus uzoniensis 768-20]
MSLKGVLVYVLSALSILIALLIVLNDVSLAGEIGENIWIRDLALAAVGFAVGVAAPILYRRFSS